MSEHQYFPTPDRYRPVGFLFFFRVSSLLWLLTPLLLSLLLSLSFTRCLSLSPSLSAFWLHPPNPTALVSFTFYCNPALPEWLCNRCLTRSLNSHRAHLRCTSPHLKCGLPVSLWHLQLTSLTHTHSSLLGPHFYLYPFRLYLYLYRSLSLSLSLFLPLFFNMISLSAFLSFSMPLSRSLYLSTSSL